MKNLFIVLAITGISLAFDPDAGSVSQPADDIVTPETDDWIISITSVNDVSMAWGSNLRGCDYGEGELFVTDYTLDSIFAVNVSTGAKTFGIPCPPAVTDVLGIVMNSEPGETCIYINDWNVGTDIWEWSTITGWSVAFLNPVSGEPRGMDLDPSDNIWGIDASTHMLYVFDLTGSVSNTWTLTQLPSGFSCGCSVFPFGSDIGVVIGGYAYNDFYFYSFDGSSLEYLGMAPVPQAIGSSYGISYSSATQSFFWIYRNPSSEFRLCEFTVEFTSALEQDTWAGIKTGS
jgi:hypothetical protein